MLRLRRGVNVICLNCIYAGSLQASVMLAVNDAVQMEADNDAAAQVSSVIGDSGRYIFDQSLFKGTSLEGVDFALLNSPDVILPGKYRVDLRVDNVVVDRADIEFVSKSVDSPVQPCVSSEYLVKTVGVKSSHFDGELSSQCQLLSEILPEASFEFDMASLALSLLVPQALLDVRPPGYVPPSLLDDGESMLFVNYDVSGYESNSNDVSVRYGYLSLNSGFNLGMWRFRNVSSLNYSDYAGRTISEWNNVRTYVQRAIPSISGELTIGDNYTSSNLFGGVNYRGVSLATDQRMFPQSQIGYAPEVRGTANTTARVIIRQAGVVVKEVTVAPGPFVINDLYATSQSGDFNVEVIEADGTVSAFVVPYASVPESMRPGFSKYSIDVGQIRSFDFTDDMFADMTYQLGVSNNLTANTGVRISEDYVALLLGGVFASDYGAFGLTTTYSSAKVEHGLRKQGWRLGLNYSKTFDPTGTSIGLAGYRYSSEGFRDLLDVIGTRYYSKENDVWQSSTLLQRNEFNISVSQPLGQYGSFYLSGSASDYYDGRSKSTQLQAGYTNSWRDLSYSLSWSRQNYFYYSDYLDSTRIDYLPVDPSGMTNVVTLSLSMPLGGGRYAPYVNSMASKSYGDDEHARFQVGVGGALDWRQPWSYSVMASYDDQSNNSSFNGNVSTNMPYANVSANYSRGSAYDQYGISVSGSLVGHSAGVTLGPRLTDTFALIEAKGAKGALVRGYSGARVDRFGYALVSSLSPYRFNSVGLDPAEADYQTEFLETEVTVAPYAGSSVKVKFETFTGYPLLITSVRENSAPIPMGAAVYDAAGVEVGMVGQGGQVYARGQQGQGYFVVKWGEVAEESCVIAYELKDMPAEALGVVVMDLPCIKRDI